MRSLIIIIFGILFMVACSDIVSTYDQANETTIWIVGRVDYNNSITSTYQMIEQDETGLNVNDTWVIDSINKFEVGDTVCFKPYRR